MLRKTTLLLFAFISICTTGIAQRRICNNGHTKFIPEGYHQHDGFYLSMSAGPVFGSIRKESNGNNVRFSGTGYELDLKIGGNIAHNLILHVTFNSKNIQNPALYLNGHTESPQRTSVTETMSGGGLTWYLMPLNIFVSGTIGLGTYSLTNDNLQNVGFTTSNTYRGPSMQFKIGKEWWIGDNWGLGAGVTYGKTILMNNNSGTHEYFDSNRFGIVLNATFN